MAFSVRGTSGSFLWEFNTNSPNQFTWEKRRRQTYFFHYVKIYPAPFRREFHENIML